MELIQKKILECFDILEKYELYDMVPVFRDEFIHAGYLITLMDGGIDDAELYTLNSMFGTQYKQSELGQLYSDDSNSKEYFLDKVPQTVIQVAEIEKKKAFGIQVMLYDTRKLYSAYKLGCAMLITCNGKRFRQEILGAERFLKKMIRYILLVENRLDEEKKNSEEDELRKMAAMDRLMGRQYIDNYYKEQEESNNETVPNDSADTDDNAQGENNSLGTEADSGEEECGKKVSHEKAEAAPELSGNEYGKLNEYMRVYNPTSACYNVDLSVSEPEKLDKLLKELDDMVGLEPVKKEVHNLVNLMRMRMIRKAHGLEVPMISMHLVFTGNPGTGKTIMARKVAEIYKAIGVLKTGVFVETDRAGLVAGYMGQTAELVHQKVNKASGGVLFIDEAYTLSNLGPESDYGQEAIDTLLKLMEDRRDDFVVIVAGYPEQMEKFLNSNPGLRSRFNKFINFEDYSASELFEMFKQFCRKNDYILDKGAEDKLLFVITEMIVKKGNTFANARDIRNLFEKVVTNQANRVIAESPTDLTAITHILERDLIVE